MVNVAKNLGFAILLVTLTPIAGWGANTGADMNTPTADVGENIAAEYRIKHPECATVVKYGHQLKPIGHVTGDPEKDTVAYPVERIETACPTEHAK